MRGSIGCLAGLFCILFSVIEETQAQKGCSNPVAKMFDEVQLLGVAQPYNLPSIECVNVLKYNCCMPKYYVFISVNFYELKSNTLDFWGKYLKPLMYSFIDSYAEFLDWYSSNEAAVDKTKANEDVAYWRSVVDSLENKKKKCFENIWKHTATMKCLVCNSDYKENFKMLRNRTIEMYLSEDMCQVLQRDCTDYATGFVEITEKSRYMFDWVKNALGVPSYSDAELKNITDYFTFTRSMYECRQTGLCRYILLMQGHMQLIYQCKGF